MKKKENIKQDKKQKENIEKYITVNGAATNNLKNIRVDIPKEKITAVVGVSGAGKTSLAFDTIHAEGYLRYIESISPYIRQFLDKIEKPPVESIDNLPPTIAFKHKKPAKNPRSIVATSMDVYDYLKILYAKLSDFHCPTCNRIIKKFTIDEIVDHLIVDHTTSDHNNSDTDEKIHVCFQYSGDIPFLINRGYYFHIQEGQKKRIDAQSKNQLTDILIDSISLKPENKSRLFEALDKSIALGGGTALVFQREQRKTFASDLYCDRCDAHYPAADEHLFSFNSPKGACPECKGFGDIQTPDPRLIFDPSLPLGKGAALPFNSPTTRRFRDLLISFAWEKGIDIHTPVKNLDQTEIQTLMTGDRYFSGINGFFRRLKKKSYKIQARVFLSRYTSYQKCNVCQGTRLNDTALSFKINYKNIAEFLNFTVREARIFTDNLTEKLSDKPTESREQSHFRHKISPDVLMEIQSRLHYLETNGLAYIQLNRHTFTLSRGEFQRINLAFILGSSLSDSLLIIDQPSADLHPRDYEKLKLFFNRLKQNGNTLLIIEHNKDIVSQCDHVIELGPLSGDYGGEIVFSGSKDDFLSQPSGNEAHPATITQNYFTTSSTVPDQSLPVKKWFTFKSADTHNLKNFDFKIPANGFTVITGVSGAGKTTLLYNEMYQKTNASNTGKVGKNSPKRVVFIDPGLDDSRGSTIVAGFFDIYTPIREFFSRLKESQISGYTPGHFSFNSPYGRCDQCKGKGYTEIEMQFLAPVQVICSHCAGSGFKPDVLKIRFKEKNIRDILDMSISRLKDTVGPQIPAKTIGIIDNIIDNGLGYLKSGQPLKTLSAGELQRIKLVKHLNTNKKDTLFLIDEPSFGLHPHDVEMIKKLFRRIINKKNTIVAAEHNMTLTAFADYMLELGPEGGENGGHLIFQGTPVDAMNCPHCLTGSYLREIIKII